MSEKKHVEQVIKLLEYHAVICPICESIDWDVEDEKLSISPIVNPTNRGFKICLTTCRICSYTLVFTAKYLD